MNDASRIRLNDPVALLNEFHRSPQCPANSFEMAEKCPNPGTTACRYPNKFAEP